MSFLTDATSGNLRLFKGGRVKDHVDYSGRTSRTKARETRRPWLTTTWGGTPSASFFIGNLPTFFLPFSPSLLLSTPYGISSALPLSRNYDFSGRHSKPVASPLGVSCKNPVGEGNAVTVCCCVLGFLFPCVRQVVEQRVWNFVIHSLRPPWITHGHKPRPAIAFACMT